MRPFLTIAAISGFLAVAAGAFGAHALQARLSPESLSVWQTGAHYHLVHSVVLMFVGLAQEMRPYRAFARAGWLFTFGMAIFAGSLYLLAVTGQKWLGAVTPLGGLCLLGGWLMLLVAGISKPSQE